MPSWLEDIILYILGVILVLLVLVGLSYIPTDRNSKLYNYECVGNISGKDATNLVFLDDGGVRFKTGNKVIYSSQCTFVENNAN